MSNRSTARLLTRLGLAVVTVLFVGGLAAAPAGASTSNFGQGVYNCAGVLLPFYIDSKGAITMTMPDGTTMHWRSFGAMVTSMQTQQMCP